MKVLQLGKFYPPAIGGIETAIFNITEGLNKKGIQTDVLCSNTKNKFQLDTIDKKEYSYKVYRTKSYGKILSTSITPQMIFILRKIINSYDIIHFHHPDPMANLALFLSYRKEKKLIIHWHSDIIKQRISILLYYPLLKWLLKKSDAIIATSPEYAKYSKQLKDFIDKVKIVPLGIDPRRLHIDEELVKNIKEKFKNKFIVFSLGRFIYYKGFQYLIEAGKYLTDEYIILIGGDGKLKKQYEEIIEKNNLKNKVILTGKIPDNALGSYYKECDIFVLPSIERTEAFGLVLLEAMSFGKPLITTALKGSGISWVNQNGITGLTVPPKNPKAIAEAIIKLKKDKKLYDKFSKNALKRFKENFTLEKEIEGIIRVYKSIL